MVGGGEWKIVSCGCFCEVMHSSGGFKVLTTGLLRVELAPEEYQLYSEGCEREEEEEEDRIQDQHEARRQATGTTVSCCGVTMQKKRCLANIQKTYSF